MAAPWEEYAASSGSAPPWQEYGNARQRIDNDAISQGARDFAKEGWGANYLNALGGAIRGSGSIGATLARPFESADENAQRRKRVDENMQQLLGSDPNSLMYQGGKIGTEIAGTMGAGGMLARGAGTVLPRLGMSAPAVNTAMTALETGGFRAPNLAARVGAGGLTGAVSAGMVDPNLAGEGALIGGLLPPGIQLAGKVGAAAGNSMRSGARNLMQSALKPTIAQLRSGDAATAVDVLLERGISPNAKGVEKLGALTDDIDSQIGNAIAGSTAQVDKNKVLQMLSGTRSNFTQQVSPQADLSAIQGVEDAFLSHPIYQGQSIPVQQAQELKRGTYRVLGGKYGEQGSASTEAQKALARGLKEEIATAVPGVSDLNSELSRLIAAKSVAERRALMDANKNPVGLGLLAPTKVGLLAFLADRSAAMKAMAARGMYSAAPLPGQGMGLLDNPNLLPYVRGGLLASEANP